MRDISLSNPEIHEAAEVLSGSVRKQYKFLTDENIKPNVVRELDSLEAHNRHPEIRHLMRLHFGLAQNIDSLMPSVDSSGLSHLAFFEMILRTRVNAGPNPVFLEDVEETVLMNLEQSIDMLSNMRKFGAELVRQWNDARGEHYICEYESGNELGAIDSTHSDVLKVDFGDVYSSAVDYANWLLNVKGDYPHGLLYHEGVTEPISSFRFVEAQATRRGLWSGYSPFVEASTTASGRMVGVKDRVFGLTSGDSQVQSQIRQLRGNVAERVNTFVKLSDPAIATPFLLQLMDGASNADMSDIVNRVTLHHSEGSGRTQQPLNIRGMDWLRGLGIIG